MFDGSAPGARPCNADRQRPGAHEPASEPSPNFDLIRSARSSQRCKGRAQVKAPLVTIWTRASHNMSIFPGIPLAMPPEIALPVAMSANLSCFAGALALRPGADRRPAARAAVGQENEGRSAAEKACRARTP